ncbi:hypothetical protein CEXT_625501 [Caerostris extrusa]|uniref:Uncharacterized protein n=1 Tax=Caerostris extrusa TaxID=172846 RepID=A0AAV4URH4_CAEEX|nr:hypothetical protein CEXT_625501 [Caerostris extrusa]
MRSDEMSSKRCLVSQSISNSLNLLEVGSKAKWNVPNGNMMRTLFRIFKSPQPRKCRETEISITNGTKMFCRNVQEVETGKIPKKKIPQDMLHLPYLHILYLKSFFEVKFLRFRFFEFVMLVQCFLPMFALFYTLRILNV